MSISEFKEREQQASHKVKDLETVIEKAGKEKLLSAMSSKESTTISQRSSKFLRSIAYEKEKWKA